MNQTPFLLYVHLPCEDDLLPYLLADWGASATEQRDADTMNRAATGVVYVAGFDQAARRDAAADAVRAAYPRAEVTCEHMTDDSWMHGWKRFFRPVILDSLAVVTPWMQSPYPPESTVVIDPGAAFGTGGHATTRLVLREMERLAPAMPSRALDVGCGSGVLAIAAVRWGCGSVDAFDIDADAVASCADNARRNGVADRVRTFVATPEDIEGTYPLVLANVQLAVFATCAPAVLRTVAPGGRLIISGILRAQQDEARALFAPLCLERVETMDEWCALVLDAP